MPDHKVLITSVAIGTWYHRGIARMVEQFHEKAYGIELQPFVNTLPPGAKEMWEHGVNYTGYGAKPWALKHAIDQGADVALLLDASFYPIRSIQPLLDHIAYTGYYLCRNGNKVGEWTSDRCLRAMALTREDALVIQECSSYAVGISRDHQDARLLARLWCEYSTPHTICGPHTSQYEDGGRNVGFVSTDTRVKGHRHDQSVLSILAHRLKLQNFVNRPLFTSYAGHQTEETVLINDGPNASGELVVIAA